MFAALAKKSLHYAFYVFATISVVLLSYSFFSNIKIANIHIGDVAFAFSVDQESISPEILGAKTKYEKLNVPPSVFHSQAYNSSYKSYVFDKYFELHNSPLQGYGKNFVDACEKYGAPEDCLLMVAIAKAETDLCKTGISNDQKNCWGFGGSGENRILYPNYATAIDEVTRRVMNGYGARFFNDAHNGELYYCGMHCAPKWGNIVNSYKSEINEFGIKLGFPSMI